MNARKKFLLHVNYGTLTTSVLPFLLLQASVLLVFSTYFSWTGVLVCALSYGVRMFAITGFYHRYFSHRTYRMGRNMQFFAALLGSTATQKGALWWAAHHRVHHKESDTQDDPHNSREGFWHSHWLWFLYEESVDTDMAAIPELARYPELRILDRLWFVPPALLGGTLYALGGWHWVVWGYFVSTFLLSNATYTINSLMHYLGKQQYFTGDESRNHWLLALITLGEGWHNNHHRYQASTRNGFFWHEIDITYGVLKVLSWLGLVRNLTPVPAKILEEGRLNRYQRRTANAAGLIFSPSQVQVSDLLAKMPAIPVGFVADTLARVRVEMQNMRVELGTRGVAWRSELTELKRQIGERGASLQYQVNDTSDVGKIALGMEWQKTADIVAEGGDRLFQDWQKMVDRVAERGDQLREEVAVLGAQVSERGQQLHGEVEALRASLGDTAQRLVADIEALREQATTTIQELRSEAKVVDLEGVFDEGVLRLSAEVDKLCEIAANKKRDLSDEMEAWASLLPRMA
jgi:stearoyl-CoA desaturase (delta-9 desaturase)